MRRPIIGITCGSSRTARGEGPEQDRLNCAYSRAIWDAGGAPVILPILGEEAVEVLLDQIDGLLLSGGADIGPENYGEPTVNETVKADAQRDRFEIPLTREAIRRDLPLLGICRGIQTLNVAMNGSLIQDLPTQRPSNIRHQQLGQRNDRTHPVEVVAGSMLREIVGRERFIANSLHHQALKALAADLHVSATAPDGVVEGVENPDHRFVIAVQFHPEELTRDSVESRRLFAAFIAAAWPRQPG